MFIIFSKNSKKNGFSKQYRQRAEAIKIINTWEYFTLVVILDHFSCWTAIKSEVGPPWEGTRSKWII